MKKMLLSVLTFLFTLIMTLGMVTACSGSAQMQITGRPNDDTIALTDTTNTLVLGCNQSGVEWSSSDEAVATVDDGVVTLYAAGSTVIGVEKDEKSDSFILTVVDERTPAAATVTIANVPQNNEILLSDGSLQLSATCSDGGELIWFSRNEAVATVDETGLVTLLQRGNVEIVAQKQGAANVYGVCALKVLADPVTALSAITGIPQSGMVSVGKTVQLSTTAEPVNCEPFETEWTVGDATVATVSATGELTGLKAGTTTVTATVKGTQITTSQAITVVETKENYEDFSTASVIGNYIVGAIEIRDASNVLSPEIVYDDAADNYYLKYSHSKANGTNKYMVYTFTGLETGARYVLKYNMKILSKEGAYNHQINLYSDYDVSVTGNPLVGNVYNWHTTGLNTETAKIYQSGSEALYRDGKAWSGSADSMDAFHEYTLGFIAGEATVGFAFVSANTFEALFDYICVEKAPAVEDYTLSTTSRLPVGEKYTVQATANESGLIYYQPFTFDWETSNADVATVDKNGCITAVSTGSVTITATDKKGVSTEMEIEIVEPLDATQKDAYDLFYEETDEAVNNTHLYKSYVLETPITNAVKNDVYILKVEMDAVYYTGDIQMYIGLYNDTETLDNSTLIGQRYWTREEFPASGEVKTTKEYKISLPWDSSDFTIRAVGMYIRYGTEYQIGVKVLSLEKYVPETILNPDDYDMVLEGEGWTNDTYELETALTGLAKNDEFTLTFEITIVSGTVDFLAFSVYNSNGTAASDMVSNSYDVNGATDGRLREIASCGVGTHTLTYTVKLKWPQTSGADVGKIYLQLCSEEGATPVAYSVGVNVTVKKVVDQMAENYDLWYVGGAESVAATYDLEQAVTGGVQYDEVEITLALDLFQGTMPRIKFYLINTANQQITDPADSGWITVADCYDQSADAYVFTTRFKWATGNWDVGTLWLLVEDGSYKLGVDVLSVKLVQNV